ncbi:MAG: Uma2 family endonuclease [Hyphomicrobiaceae bacterium]|nr:Uma2 family endonuclease [Hyphomicrobiaceae bacterium]
MLKPKRRPATYADIEALPPNVVGEILFGALHGQPRPAPRHAVAANVVGAEITGRFQFRRSGGPGGWIFMIEPELHLGPHVVVPDIAGWKRERLTPFPDTAYIETSPDWLCEVLSPSTQALDRTDKLSVYAEYGVGHCWYVDPLAETLEVFALTGAKWLLAATFKDADPVTAPPFEAHTFPLDLLWVRDEPPSVPLV